MLPFFALHPEISQPAARAHVYVADNINNQVVEFPIDRNGLPSLKPDIILHLNGSAYGIAIDGSGSLYVSVFLTATGKDVVEVFPPGANGFQKPRRTISYGAQLLQLAFDVKDNLFVEFAQTIGIYAPPTFSRQIAVLTMMLPVNDMATDGRALYVNEVGQIAVYLAPLKRQSPDGIVLPQGGFETAIDGSLAIDKIGHRLFFNTWPHVEQPWGNFDFAVRPLPGYEPSTMQDPIIESTACPGPDGGPGFSTGAAMSGPYLLAGCVGNVNGTVFVYDSRKFGHRQPVEGIGPGYVQSVGDVRVWP